MFRNSIFTQFFDVDSQYKVEQYEINDLAPNNFMRRMLCVNINSNAPELLLNRKGEWLVIDTYDINLPLGIIQYPDLRSRLVQTSFIDEIGFLFKRNEKFKNCKFTPIRATDASINMKYYIDRAVTFLKKNWGDKIILINASQAHIGLDKNGIITKTNDNYVEAQQRSNKMSEILLDNLNCHYIELPRMIIRDFLSYHDWNSVHYISEITEYLKDMVDIIVTGRSDPNEISKTRIRYDTIISDIIIGRRASEQNTIKRVNALINKNEIDEKRAINDLEKLIEEGSFEAYGARARLYRTGTYFEKNLDKAAEWMRMATYGDVGWAKNELFDILWNIGSPEAYEEMISVAKNFAESGDGGAMVRLGRAYSNGKGVEKDLTKAAEWMRSAVNANIGWAKNELFDILWNIGSPEAYEEMISVAKNFAESGDGGAMVRLGRAYSNGKGVEKDLDKALEWMRKASEKIWYCGREFVDNLLTSTSDEHHKEAFDVCSRLIEKRNDAESMGRLGRIYRDGKGVEKDLDKAAKWMRKAANKNIEWAKDELSAILMEISSA